LLFQANSDQKDKPESIKKPGGRGVHHLKKKKKEKYKRTQSTNEKMRIYKMKQYVSYCVKKQYVS